MARVLKFNLIIFFWFISLAISAQDALHFIGHNFFDEKELLNTTVQVVSGKTIISELNTGNSPNFKVVLPYGKTYDMYFKNASCQTMFLRIYADIPVEKRDRKITYELKIPFFANDPVTFDTSEFRNPFHKIVFNSKTVFVDDTTYMNTFLSRVVKKETEQIVLKPTPTKEYVQLVGRLCFDNDKQTPLKNKNVSLIDKKGDVISNSQTTNFGVVIFQRVDIQQANGIAIKLSDSDNPNKEKIKLQNSSSDLIAISSINANQVYEYKNSPENHVIEKMIDKNFRYNIGGKLIATDGDVKKIMSDKTVYLLDAKNNVVQKSKTNALGSFLFTKVLSNQAYSIAFDETEVDPNSKLNLYTVKDKLIQRLDSIKNKRFNYKFLAIASSSFNDLVIDDVELKMKVRGKMYGDNKNNPLSNLKVFILNDKYQAIDSTVTNKEGDFSVDNVSYLKHMSITAKSDANMLEAFNNILVFDNSENLIKIVALQKEKKFNYKPLPLEYSKITELYVDDPWLKVINRKSNKANETIVEAILFDFDKADLLVQSQQTLDKVVLAMTANKQFKVELSAHSDSKGSDIYNLKLSEQRANSAKNYIASKGIDVNRIIAKGFGETKLLNNCGNSTLCSEDEHAVNRRIEFKLIFE